MGVVRRTYNWFDERLGITETVLPIVTHPVPEAGRLSWAYVFGSATLTTFLVQVVTGVALAMSYVPSTADAYNSLVFISDQAVFGSVIRGMHFFGASAMVILVGIHAIRVFLFGSYKYPREVTWLTGVFLLALTLAMGFSGQLLRWDQTAVWSTVVAAEQVARTPIAGDWLARVVVAGRTVGPATLTRFFATHVFLLPALIFGLIGVHLYLVVRLGISEPPVAGKPVVPATYRREYHHLLRHGQPFFPDAAWKDALVALVVVAAILVLAIVFGPPQLDRPADPTLVSTYPRPDWYLLWYFALLALLPKAVEDYFIIGFPLLVGFVLFVLPILGNKGERAPSRRPWALAAVGTILLVIGVLTQQGFLSPWSPNIADAGKQAITAEQRQRLGPLEQAGVNVYEQYGCITCHQIGSSGGNRGPALDHVGSRLDHDQLVIQILRGRGNMPAYADIVKPEQTEALVAFLSALK